MDSHANFASSTVATAPTPALSGLSLAVTSAASFPAVPFNCTVCPAGVQPTTANAEIVRVTNIVGTTFTIARAQEGSVARTILVGDQIALTITAKVITDLQPVTVESAQAILEPGISGQVRAGRVLSVADFTTLLGLTTPVGLFNLSDLTNLGSGGALTNKGTVTFPAASDITGALANAQFTGSTAQALYIADAGAADPFRIAYGSVGCWFKNAKQASMRLVTKMNSGATIRCFDLSIDGTANTVDFAVGSGGASYIGSAVGVSNVSDDRWHFAVGTYDGTILCIYVDGVLETVAVATTPGPIGGGAAPFNIGGYGADGSTAATQPMYGRIDEAFVTSDVLSADQVRMLYAAKVAHGASFTPTAARVNVRRRRRGGALATTDFSATPKHLYNFTAGALTDAGTLGTALTNNGTTLAAPGADGALGNAFNFVAASTQYLSATDTGLPAAGAARSLGCWMKTASLVGAQAAVAYGTAATGLEIDVNAGVVTVNDPAGGTLSSSFVVGDSMWHFVVFTYDAAAVDGLKRKLYVDGKLVAADTNVVNTTLLGATGFHVGKRPDTIATYFNGEVDGVFVTDYAMTADEQAKLYAVGSLALAASPVDAGLVVEQVDATNVYMVLDRIDSQNQVDVVVAP